MRVSTLLSVLAFALVPGAALAQWAAWDDEYEEAKKSWKEIEGKIPPYPQGQNLVNFQAGASNHRFYIDANSVSMGEDGVMRYTSVTKTAGGATNVTFEGIRCETRERKLYALGRSDGSWARARDPKWTRIEQREHTLHLFVLWREFFCPSKVKRTTAREAVDAIKRSGGPLSLGEGR